MALKIIAYTLGPLGNNSYLAVDLSTKLAAVIDPAMGSTIIVSEALKNNYQITHIWCTHAHFDHISGIDEVLNALPSNPSIFLHENDLSLWQQNGGAKLFNFPFETKTSPTHLLKNDETLQLGNLKIYFYHTPGHTAGHVIYHIKEEDVVFSGDLIFRMSVGRTDLPGGNHLQLLNSIDRYIKPLPDNTRLLSGHGPETTVGYEKKYNPFL